MIKYPKELINQDLTVLEENILFMHLKNNIAFEDMLKSLRGNMYMRYKSCIAKIQKHLDYSNYILLDERYFTLKLRNSRRLYKLYLLLNKPSLIPFSKLELVNIPVYKYHSYNKRVLNPIFKELTKVFGLHFGFTESGISIDDVSNSDGCDYEFELILKVKKVVANVD
jgi:hypothetical protein